MTETLGMGVGVSLEGVFHDSRNTLASSDFAYWCSTYVVRGVPSDYVDEGLEKSSASLISWACNQVGITDMPSTYDEIKSYCASKVITTSEALSKRGALLINDDDIAITLGLKDIVLDIYGRHFIKKVDAYYLSTWSYGALIPGLEYK